jgi:hypothetical protein
MGCCTALMLLQGVIILSLPFKSTGCGLLGGSASRESPDLANYAVARLRWEHWDMYVCQENVKYFSSKPVHMHTINRVLQTGAMTVPDCCRKPWMVETMCLCSPTVS